VTGTTLTPDQRADWQAHGWLHLTGLLDDGMVTSFDRWVDEVARWAADAVGGLHHHEQTEHGPALARSECFADEHAELGRFIRGPRLGHVLEQVLGEPAVLFKEKINYKHPGGAGFAPHQDATAYRFVDHHVSVMVPLDAATVASGCLWFAPGHHDGSLPTDDRGRITEAVASQLAWRPVEVAPGDVVMFDSYTPHYSDSNTTGRSRRALYLTYNAGSRGDFRDRYYADKQAEFDREGQTFGDQRVRMSISDDFLGRPVETADG